jgi:hypothetical protein
MKIRWPPPAPGFKRALRIFETKRPPIGRGFDKVADREAAKEPFRARRTGVGGCFWRLLAPYLGLDRSGSRVLEDRAAHGSAQVVG